MKNKNKIGWFFIAPSLVGVAMFVLLPMLYTIIYSIMDSNATRFVGAENFINVIKNEAFHLALRNTVQFTVICIPLLILTALLVSVLLTEWFPGSYILKSIFLIPMAVPCVSVVFLWNILFARQGFLNGLLHKFGLVGQDWMNTKYAFVVLVLSYIWKNVGYDIILFLVGMVNIPKAYYEAAKVDGAGKWKSFLYITLPNLKSVFTLVMILSLINSFKVFREAYLVSGKYPHESIYMLQNLFNNWFSNLEFSKMAAATVLICTVILTVVETIRFIVRKKRGIE